jgi:quercetin dioxygenase-like cupin family protein
MAENERICVYEMQSSPLDSLLFHSNCDCLTRLAPTGFPVQVAVHVIRPMDREPAPYVELHTHETPEVNILVSTQGDLTYLYRSSGEQFTVKAPACVWIPPRVPHAEHVISGSGIFVCLILSEDYHAQRG